MDIILLILQRQLYILFFTQKESATSFLIPTSQNHEELDSTYIQPMTTPQRSINV